MEEKMVVINLTKAHCKHICKCHNEAPFTTNILINCFLRKIIQGYFENYTPAKKKSINFLTHDPTN
jgi:hypothetical protein